MKNSKKELNYSQKVELLELLEERTRRKAKDNLKSFIRYTFPDYQFTHLHDVYCEIMDLWVNKHIKNLIISMPPQHGKSEISTRRVPAMVLGKYPDERLAVVSYAATKSKKFNREIQRIIDSPEYNSVYPETLLNESDYGDSKTGYIRTTDEFEIVGKKGSLKSVGRGGPLTGDPVDRLIMDDLYKDYEEGNSPVIRQSVVDWYDTVADSRLHNESQQLIVFTRWHEDDLIGVLESRGHVVDINSVEDAINLPDDKWGKINFQALKTGEKTELDPREEGKALWPEKHSRKRQERRRSDDPIKFDCLYQGEPRSKEGYLYSDFNLYAEIPDGQICNYTDTADTGTDYLCSIDFVLSGNKAYILDIVYTDKAMEDTEPMVANMLNSNGVNRSVIESNNGGRGFARAVDKLTTGKTSIEWFHQSLNKEARILTNATSVNKNIIFPIGWAVRWPGFHTDIKGFKRNFKANRHDDGPDCLTGIIEKFLTFGSAKSVRVIY